LHARWNVPIIVAAILPLFVTSPSPARARRGSVDPRGCGFHPIRMT
jgi:hypothetical protein